MQPNQSKDIIMKLSHLVAVVLASSVATASFAAPTTVSTSPASSSKITTVAKSTPASSTTAEHSMEKPATGHKTVTHSNHKLSAKAPVKSSHSKTAKKSA